MLKYKRKRLIRISLAVFIPIIVGLAILLYLNQFKQVSISDLDIISNSRKLFSSSDKLSDSNAKKADVSIKKQKEQTVDTLGVYNDLNSDSTQNTPILMDSFIGNSEVEYTHADTIQLIKDVMIAKKTYIIPILKADIHLDSLLMNKTNESNTLNFTIEFWASPIRFTGYKRSANKAIIFGISDIENAELSVLENNYFLIINNSVYQLDLTDRFKKLVERKME
ncbi:MAG: hypothetical protein WCP69_02825 [Bacteroidota bacterium]